MLVNVRDMVMYLCHGQITVKSLHVDIMIKQILYVMNGQWTKLRSANLHHPQAEEVELRPHQVQEVKLIVWELSGCLQQVNNRSLDRVEMNQVISDGQKFILIYELMDLKLHYMVRLVEQIHPLTVR